MTIRLSCVAFTLIALSAALAGAESLTPGAPAVNRAGSSGTVLSMPSTMTVAREASPGEIVRVFASGDRLPHLVEVADAQGAAIAIAHPIDLRMTGVLAARGYLLGIDSTTTPGAYQVRGVAADGSLLFERPLEIESREFRSERIALTSALTALRSEYDPRKVEESRVLTDLLFSADPLAVHHPGRLGWPLTPDTRRTSLYGDRRTYLYSDGATAPAIHVGLDLASPAGTPIASAGRGVVRMARDRIVTGLTVVIEHLPGVYTLYYHLNELAVEEGELVDTGRIIGTVGATGLATGPHLHWELRVAGVAVSPESATVRGLLVDAAP